MVHQTAALFFCKVTGVIWYCQFSCSADGFTSDTNEPVQAGQQKSIVVRGICTISEQSSTNCTWWHSVCLNLREQSYFNSCQQLQHDAPLLQHLGSLNQVWVNLFMVRLQNIILHFARIRLSSSPEYQHFGVTILYAYSTFKAAIQERPQHYTSGE